MSLKNNFIHLSEIFLDSKIIKENNNLDFNNQNSNLKKYKKLVTFFHPDRLQFLKTEWFNERFLVDLDFNKVNNLINVFEDENHYKLYMFFYHNFNFLWVCLNIFDENSLELFNHFLEQNFLNNRFQNNSTEDYKFFNNSTLLSSFTKLMNFKEIEKTSIFWNQYYFLYESFLKFLNLDFTSKLDSLILSNILNIDVFITFLNDFFKIDSENNIGFGGIYFLLFNNKDSQVLKNVLKIEEIKIYAEKSIIYKNIFKTNYTYQKFDKEKFKSDFKSGFENFSKDFNDFIRKPFKEKKESYKESFNNFINRSKKTYEINKNKDENSKNWYTKTKEKIKNTYQKQKEYFDHIESEAEKIYEELREENPDSEHVSIFKLLKKAWTRKK